MVLTRTHARGLGLETGTQVWLTPASGATVVPSMRPRASVLDDHDATQVRLDADPSRVDAAAAALLRGSAAVRRPVAVDAGADRRQRTTGRRSGASTCDGSASVASTSDGIDGQR